MDMTEVTPEQEMKTIVEAVGECWHEWKLWNKDYNGYKCKHCSIEVHQVHSYNAAPSNPSPTDMNELFRLVKKLGYVVALYTNDKGTCSVNLGISDKVYFDVWAVDCDTPADALRTALCQAVKKGEE
jgi:hypothetical protein